MLLYIDKLPVRADEGSGEEKEEDVPMDVEAAAAATLEALLPPSPPPTSLFPEVEVRAIHLLLATVYWISEGSAILTFLRREMIDTYTAFLS